MRNVLALAAIGATLSFAAAASAQAPASKPTAPTTGAPSTARPSDATPSAAPAAEPTAPSSAAAPPSAAGAGSNAAANAGGTLMTGMSVKDNTGAIIGEVKDLKAGVATITMGSDSFTVDANKLGVSGGAATINATQAQLKQMIVGATKK
jgi:hypothetical protein